MVAAWEAAKRGWRLASSSGEWTAALLRGLQDKVEGRLRLTGFWVMLSDQFLVPRCRYPNVDVGWPTLILPGEVALEPVLALLSGRHSSPVSVVVVALRIGPPELDLGIGNRLATVSR